MRINRIILENFRCFGHTEIDLSGDIVAIYGRNGVGKTALFDALEFAMIGSIGRFAKDSSPPFYLPNVMSDKNMKVRIEFKGEINDWAEVTIDRMSDFDVHIDSSGGWRTQRDLLYGFLVDENYSPPRREVSTIAELFRSTVLLAQHTIGQFIEGDSAERSRILSYLAGSGYIQRCLDKAQEVIKEAKKRERIELSKLEETKEKAIELKKNAAEKDARIQAIREKLGKVSISHDMLLKYLRTANISVEQNIPNTYENVEIFAASIKSASNERIAALDDRNKKLAQIEAMNLQHPDRTKRRNELRDMIQKARANLTELLNKEHNAAENLKALEKRIKEINLNISDKSNTLKALKMLPELKRQWEELAKAKDKRSNIIALMKNELDLLKSKVEQEQIALNSAQREIAPSKLKATNTSTKLEKLEALKESLPAYANAKKTIIQLESQLNEIGGKRTFLKNQRTELRDQRLKIDDRAGELKRKISVMNASLQEETDLISRLRQYVTDNKCPMCGHVHHSDKALQNAINARINDVPASHKEILKEVQELSNKLAILKAKIENIENEIKAADDYFALAQKERDKEVSIIREMEAKAASLGTSLDLEDVKHAIDESKGILANQQSNQRKIEERFYKAKNSVNLTMAAITSVEEALAAQNEAYKKSESELDSLELRFSELGLLNDRHKTHHQWQLRLESIQKQLTDLEAEKSSQGTVKSKTQNEWDSIRSERMKLEEDLKKWEETIARLTTEIEDFQFKCKALGLPINASSEAINKERDHLSQEKEKLDAAIKMIQRYEWYVKVSALENEQAKNSALINNIEKEIKEKTTEIEKIKEASNKAEKWITALFESVNTAVKIKIDAHQSEIVRLFKAMIPWPYLFEKVSLAREKTGIRLGLFYHGQEQESGEPRFFLSSAQANVLALSIFLSLSAKQNWSKLETILLDDPVQHLDDLDAVAFLDNLRAMALGRFGPKKQIIVSTCDKNLYLLMIRKFRLLEGDGIKFTGISMVGKELFSPEIIYDVGGPDDRKHMLRAV